MVVCCHKNSMRPQDKWPVHGFSVMSDVFISQPAQFCSNLIEKRRSSLVSVVVSCVNCVNVNALQLRSGFVCSVCGFRSTHGCRNCVVPRRTLIFSLRVCVSCSGGTDLFTNRSLVLTKGSGQCCPLAGIVEYRLVGQTWKRGRGSNNGVKNRTVKTPF